ncbi:MAG: cytochrome c oxidase subunit 3 family protein [Acidobacteriaceae bacterium]|nr:cytochrome c oxidase subunit 3 family protein [Acidobacteriaceae bacterium]
MTSSLRRTPRLSHSETTTSVSHLQAHFQTMEQQRETSVVGMWIFLGTEVMFFSGLFTSYLVYRLAHYAAFAAASKELSVTIGAINTAILIASSLTMAMSVHEAQLGRRKLVIIFLILTLVFGLTFLGLKGYEWYDHIEKHELPGFNFHLEPEKTHGDPRSMELFFGFYFCMTGLHALHMIVGAGLVTWVLIKTWKWEINAEYHNPVETVGLYWHFVDIIWIYLFPLLYLIDRHP